MNITMDGKYAYRAWPRKQVRVLCVDAPGTEPVVSLGLEGTVRTHHASGRYLNDVNESVRDLVPLDESLTVTPGIYRTRDGTCVTICYIRSDAEAARYPVIGWDEASTGALTWKLDGIFLNAHKHRLDLVERIGDLP